MKKWVLGAGLAVFIIIASGAGFAIGRFTADAPMGTTFFATIKEADGNRFLADGMEVNDINNRGEVYFSIDNKTELKWRNTDLTVAALTPGATTVDEMVEYLRNAG